MKSDFLFPKAPRGKKPLYFVGNSLGLQPKKARAYVNAELDKWSRLAIEGHLKSSHPWYFYHEFLSAPMARIVGGRPSEVVVMNTLTVNLHLLMVSFYRPTASRFKILIEETPFPSDRYAVASQARFHGFDPREAIVTAPMNELHNVLKARGSEFALVLIGTSNFLTGEVPDLGGLCKLAHAQGALFGVDLAHGAGSIPLRLHDWGVDFGAWCSYKYLNGGPGTLGGVFIHERHHDSSSKTSRLPRFEGWWGHDKVRRFEFAPEFSPMSTAEAWQLSNPPILQMAALRASLEIFDRVGIEKVVTDTARLVAALESKLSRFPKTFFEIVTPSDPKRRGGHLALRFRDGLGPQVERALAREGVWVDFRSPDIIRVACPSLYVTLPDLEAFVKILKSIGRKMGRL